MVERGAVCVPVVRMGGPCMGEVVSVGPPQVVSVQLTDLVAGRVPDLSGAGVGVCSSLG